MGVLSLSLTHTCTHSLTHSSPSHMHSLTQPLTCTLLTQSLTHSLARSSNHSHALNPTSPSLPHSLPHSLTLLPRSDPERLLVAHHQLWLLRLAGLHLPLHHTSSSDVPRPALEGPHPTQALTHTHYHYNTITIKHRDKCRTSSTTEYIHIHGFTRCRLGDAGSHRGRVLSGRTADHPQPTCDPSDSLWLLFATLHAI